MKMNNKNLFQKTAVRTLPIALMLTFALVATGCIVIGGGSGSESRPSAPTGISIKVINSNKVRVSWNTSWGADYYRLYWADSASGPFDIVEGASKIYETYFEVNIDSGWTYYFRVAAVTSTGESAQSDTVSATSGGSSGYAPSIPPYVYTDVLSRSSIRVSWDSVSGATSYKVYYAVGSSYTKYLAGTAYGTSYTHSGLYSNTDYWYYIKAVNSYGESDYSTVKLGHTN
jgi:predicted phage tail protein